MMCCVSRVEKWERRTEVPLVLLALAFLVAYAWPILDPTVDRSTRELLDATSWTVWAAFALDLVVRVGLAEQRVRYLRDHWYDVALVALPMLRPLRLLRLLALARMLNRGVAGSLANRVTVYVVGVALAAVGLGALAVLDAERDADGANLVTIGDALWWAATTVTTVGYGDYYPVTVTGRLVALCLMLVGIAVVGSVTASVASWFIDSARRGHAGADHSADP